MAEDVRTLIYGVGEMEGKHHAFCELSPNDRFLGPARDTEEEAMQDRDEIVALHKHALKERVIAVNKNYGVEQ